MTIRMQHYVWRYYLESWQVEDGLVHCLRKGRTLRLTNPKNLMVERDFYRLYEITPEEMGLLKALIEFAKPPLREIHLNFITALAYFANSNDLIQNSDQFSFSEKQDAERIAIEIVERLQGQTEQSALPILNALRRRDNEFIGNDTHAILFFHFLAHQYFRTKHTRESIEGELAQISPDHDFTRLANMVCYIAAINLGASLFLNRKQADIIFLDDIDKVDFITGDQPVVNLMSASDGSEPTGLAMYYPLSPRLACLVAPKEYNLRSGGIPSEIVKELNEQIASESTNFWIARSSAALQRTASDLSLSRPPAYHVLELLRQVI